MSGFGKAKIGAGSFTKEFKLQTPKNDNETTEFKARLIPPIKSCVDTGDWAKYHGTHFGHKGTNRADPGKLKIRTFGCIEQKNMKSGIVTVACPQCDELTRHKDQLKTKEAQAIAAGKTPEQIDLILTPLKQWIKDYNCDRKWHINVMTVEGELGTLQLSHRTKKQLEAKIVEAKSEGIDAFDVEAGCYFNFKRTGRMLSTVDTIEVLTQSVKIDGRSLQEVKPAPMTQDQQLKALDTLPDLNDRVRVLTYDQIKQLVNGSGDPTEVDVIFDGAQSNVIPIRSETKGVVKPNKLVESVLEQQTQAKPVETEEADEGEAAALAAYEAAVAAAKAKKAAKVPTVVVDVPSHVVEAPAKPSGLDMTPEEFLKAFT